MTDELKEPEPPPAEDSEAAKEPADALRQSIINPKCDLCGSAMIEWHCRMMCPMCGYQRDCSDP
jgi:hypothetical protein